MKSQKEETIYKLAPLLWLGFFITQAKLIAGEFFHNVGTIYPSIYSLNHDGLFSICGHLRQKQLKHLIISLVHIDNRALKKKILSQ